MTNRRPKRHGFAMILVVLFLVLILGMWGQAARQLGSLVRIEGARAARVRRDAERAPAAAALARALATLELGFPPSSPYTCAVEASNGTVYAATFERESQSPNEWVVSVAPTSESSLPPLDPAQFGALPASQP